MFLYVIRVTFFEHLCLKGPDDCEFDDDKFCYWTNEPNNVYTFDWLRGTGATPSTNTGPTADHTTGTGMDV